MCFLLLLDLFTIRKLKAKKWMLLTIKYDILLMWMYCIDIIWLNLACDLSVLWSIIKCDPKIGEIRYFYWFAAQKLESWIATWLNTLSGRGVKARFAVENMSAWVHVSSVHSKSSWVKHWTPLTAAAGYVWHGIYLETDVCIGLLCHTKRHRGGLQICRNSEFLAQCNHQLRLLCHMALCR